MNNKYKYNLVKKLTDFYLLNLLIILVCSTLFTCSLYAQKEVDKSSLSKYIINDYRVQSQLYITNKTIEEKINTLVIEEMPKLGDLDNLHIDSDKIDIENKVWQVTEAALKRYFSESDELSPQQKRLLNDYISSLPYKVYNKPNRFILHILKVKLVSVARLHGVAIAVVWAATELAQISSVAVLTSLGYGSIAALAPVVPITFTNVAIALQIKSMRQNKQLIEGYGSRELKRKAVKIEKQVVKSRNIRNSKSVVYFFENPKEEKTYGISLNNENIVAKVGSWMTRKSNRMLYWAQLSEFAKKHDIAKKEIKNLRKEKLKNRQAQSVFLLHKILKDSSSTVDFANKFEKFVFEVDKISDNENALRQWATKAMYIKTIEEIPNVLHAIPPGAKIGEVIDLIDNIILPYWTKEIKSMDFIAFRRFVKQFTNVKFESAKFHDSVWTSEWSVKILKEL